MLDKQTAPLISASVVLQLPVSSHRSVSPIKHLQTGLTESFPSEPQHPILPLDVSLDPSSVSNESKFSMTAAWSITCNSQNNLLLSKLPKLQSTSSVAGTFFSYWSKMFPSTNTQKGMCWRGETLKQSVYSASSCSDSKRANTHVCFFYPSQPPFTLTLLLPCSSGCILLNQFDHGNRTTAETLQTPSQIFFLFHCLVLFLQRFSALLKNVFTSSMFWFCLVLCFLAV